MTVEVHSAGHDHVLLVAHSDAEAVRWWRIYGEPTDVLDTGEPMTALDEQLGLEP